LPFATHAASSSFEASPPLPAFVSVIPFLFFSFRVWPVSQPRSLGVDLEVLEKVVWITCFPCLLIVIVTLFALHGQQVFDHQ
jgi:hypothetical protein